MNTLFNRMRQFSYKIGWAAALSLSMGNAFSQTLIKYEAESAQLNGVATTTAVGGYSDSGYTDPNSFDTNGDNVTFTVNAPAAGAYPLVVRYGGFNGDKTQTIKVNGATISNCATNFPASSGFTDLSYGNITLNSGSNTITIEKCYGWMAMDYITIGTTSGGSSGSNNGTGLLAEYFNNTDLSGTAVTTKTEPCPNNDYGSAAPIGTSVGADGFSIRWTGQVEAPVSGTYTFTSNSDDGQRLWINGQQIINDWNYHGATDASGTITLSAGQKYDIKYEYFEATGNAVVKLNWAYSGQARQVIPTTRLYPASGGGGNNGTGLQGVYFNNKTLTAPSVLTRTDSKVDFDWGNTSPGGSVATDNFSVRWSGQVEAPVSGNYTFSTTSDDGIRLSVNGSQIINNWTDHGPATDNSAAVSLTAGQKYTITLEYYENGGGATAKLMWAYPGQTQQIIPQTRLYPASTSGDTEVPSTPGNVTTSAITQSSLTLSWTASTDNQGVTGYDIYRNSTYLASTTSTIYNVTGLSCGTSYSFYIKAKDAAGNQSANSSTVSPSTSACNTGSTGMTAGTQFWNIGWESPSNFFASGVNWATTTNPWNPTFISELQAARMKTLRFMDWNNINDCSARNWSQRIPKTANHYNVDNKNTCYRHDYDGATNTHTITADAETGYGVAYEWQIDLCNRIGADLWINIPVNASADYQYQLATLIKNQLNSNLKVYVEWGNETWNFSFATWVYAYQQGNALNLGSLNYGGAYVEPWWAYTAYASVRAFEQFQNVFGVNNSRIVKVICGQVGYHWGGTSINHVTAGHLAALANSTINPNGTTINAYGVAPYMGGQSMAAQTTAVDDNVQGVVWVKNTLNGTGIKVVCYEGGSDNYPDNSLALTRDAQQESIYVNYLSKLDDYVDGPFNQYTFYGGCWGLKKEVGESPSIAPKWRGWIDYWVNGMRSRQGADADENVAPAGSAVNIYPNPASSTFTIMTKKGTQLVRLLNNQGYIVKTVTPIVGANTIDISTLPAGLYTVVVTNEAGTSESARLMIE